MPHRRTSFLSIAVIALTSSLVVAQNQGGNAAPPIRGAGTLDRLMSADSDGDGRLSRTELPERVVERIFDQADTNKDGYLDRAELEAFAASRGGPPAGRGQGARAEPSFDGHMSAAGRSMRRLSRSSFDGSELQRNLNFVSTLQLAMVGAKRKLADETMSAKAQKKFGSDVAAYRAAFRRQLMAVLAESITLEGAILSSDAGAAKASVQRMISIRDSGHDLFQAKQEEEATRGKRGNTSNTRNADH